MPKYFTRYLQLKGPATQRYGQCLAAAGTVLAAAAVFAPLGTLRPSLVMFAILLCFAALPLVDKAEQLALDPINGRFRHFNSFFGFTWGAWQALPRISKVVVKPFSQLDKGDKFSWPSSSPRRSRIVLLSVPTSRRAIVAGKFSDDQEAEALLFAKELAVCLGVEGFVLG